MTNKPTYTAARNPALNPTQVPLEWVQRFLQGHRMRITYPAAGLVVACTETELFVEWDATVRGSPLYEQSSYSIFGPGPYSVAVLMPHHDDAPAPKRARRASVVRSDGAA